MEKQIIQTKENTIKIEIFDPPLCCPTGICGPTVDQTLISINEMIASLQKDGIQIERYQMTSHPHAFINNPEVMKLVQERQMAALPITVISSKVIKTGAYPTLEEINAALEAK
jgi:hypothetical protein